MLAHHGEIMISKTKQKDLPAIISLASTLPVNNSSMLSGFSLETSSWQVQDAIGLMRSDYGHLQTIAVIAESVGLCPRQLERLFKAETGLTPIQYLRQLRLEQACQLLLNSPVSIKEIAVCVGLSSQSYFVREFKRAFHMTPSEFRQGYKNSRLSLKNQLMS